MARRPRGRQRAARRLGPACALGPHQGAGALVAPAAPEPGHVPRRHHRLRPARHPLRVHAGRIHGGPHGQPAPGPRPALGAPAPVDGGVVAGAGAGAVLPARGGGPAPGREARQHPLQPRGRGGHPQAHRLRPRPRPPGRAVQDDGQVRDRQVHGARGVAARPGLHLGRGCLQRGHGAVGDADRPPPARAARCRRRCRRRPRRRTSGSVRGAVGRDAGPRGAGVGPLP
mmetsp:Transcript_28795/g.60310  ORF Transcript_28795/g.60310 Transcript_28795/m.60310 type:complete len:228 (+) Transcript_28795:303-986(+)